MKRNTVLLAGSAIAALVTLVGSCSAGEPYIEKVPVQQDDLAEAMGVILIKYVYDISAYPIPTGKQLTMHCWAELQQPGKQTVNWDYDTVYGCKDSGSILLAYYSEPLFTNDGPGVLAKMILSIHQNTFRTLIRPEVPFKISGFRRTFQRERVATDREYVLEVLNERYSPRAETFTRVAPDPEKASLENKALLFKAKFVLVDK